MIRTALGQQMLESDPFTSFQLENTLHNSYVLETVRDAWQNRAEWESTELGAQTDRLLTL